MNGLGPYHSSILAARQAGLTLSSQQGEALFALLAHYAQELEERVAKGLASGGQVQALGEAKGLLQRMWKDIQAKTSEGVSLTARRQAELHARATIQLLEANGAGGLTAYTEAAFRGIGTAAAQAVLARPAFTAAFRGIQQTSVQAADQILTTGILRGSEPAEIARALRLHIAGAEAFPAGALQDLRTIGYGTLAAMGLEATPENLRTVREKAGAIARHSRMTTRTEIMNAEQEAGVQAAIDSPVVAALHWFLSNRHPEPDECDVYATADLFGLGPGNYDPRQYPARPHPRCLCGRTHILRPVKEWGQPRGALPPLQADLEALGDTFKLAPSQRKNLAAGLKVGTQQPKLTPATPHQVATYQAAHAAEVKAAAAAYRKKAPAALQGPPKGPTPAPALAQLGAQLKSLQVQKAAAEANAAAYGELRTEVLGQVDTAAAASAAAKLVKEMKAAVAAAEAAVADAEALGSASAAQKAQATLQDAQTQLAKKVAANAASSAKHAAKKKAEAAAAKAAQEAKAQHAVSTATATLAKAHAAKPNVAALKTLVAEAETAVSLAEEAGHPGALHTAKNALTVAKQKLAAKQAANKASSQKHAAKKKATPTVAAAKEIATASQEKTLAAAAQAKAAPTALPAERLTAEVVLHQKTGEQGGSNPGGFYKGKDGVTRYVKFYDDPTQAQGEVLANTIYRELGLTAPKSGTIQYQGKTAFFSEVLDGVEGTLGKKGLTAARANAVLDGFAADVLTANWDAIGLKYDNVVVLKGGGIARVDQGGTLLFRAKAGRKSPSLLNLISEWDYFTDPKNPSYKAIFDAAHLANAYELGERVIQQIDGISQLRTRVGGWAKFVERTAPALAAADRKAITGMLEARTALLEAKRAEVRGYAEKLRRAEAEARKQLERLKALVGKPFPRSEADQAQVATFRAAIETETTKEVRDYIRGKITNREPGMSPTDLAHRKEVERVKLRALKSYLVTERGISPTKAAAMVSHYDAFFKTGGWQGSAESMGAAAIKWAGTELHGLPTSFHDGFYDHDAKRQLEVRQQGENVATANGRFSKSDMLALFQAERNFSRAFGEALQIPTFTVYRNVHEGFFHAWKATPPKKGEVLVVEHNSVVGFRGTVAGFNGPAYRFEVTEYTWDDMLRHFWTHANSSFTNENEIWFFYRPVRHKVAKAPQ